MKSGRPISLFWPVAALVLWVWLLPSAVEAQQGGLVIELPPDSSAELLQEALFDRWFAWKRHITEGDLGTAEAVEAEILNMVQTRQIQGVNVLGGATAREGFSLMEAGRTEEARMAFELAVKVKDDLPQAHYGLAELSLKAEKSPTGWLRHSLAGFSRQVRGIWGSFFLKANLLLILVAGLLLFTVVFALVEFLKYHKLFRHAFSETFSRKTTMDVGRMLGFAFLLIPALLWLGPPILALWWLAVLYSYLDTREKVAAWIGAIVLAVLPLGLQQVHARTTHLDDPVLRAASKLAGGDVDSRTLQELDQALARDPEDHELRFLYSLALSRAGQSETARTQLKELTSRDARNERAWNNLGNIYFRENDYAQALLMYQKSTEAGSCYALAHYNMALAHQNMLQSPLYHEEMERARNCNAELVDQFSSGEGVVDADLSNEELLALVKGDDARASIGQLIRYPLSILAIITLLYLATRSMGKSKRPPVRACIKCGRAFCNACQPGASTSSYCTQCLHLYIKKDGVAPAVRIQKSKEVERHATRARWYARALNFFLPGSGHVFEDKTLSGLVLLALWSLLLAAFFAGGAVIEYPEQVVAMRSSFLLLLNILGLGLVWLIANVPPLLSRR